MANVTAAEGDDVELTCEVGTALQVPLQFQWFSNGVMLPDERYRVKPWMNSIVRPMLLYQ